MTKNGEVVEKNENLDEIVDKAVEAMEARAIAEKQPAYAKLLKPEQVEAMLMVGIESIEDVRAASDEELVKIKGIGLSALNKLREWSSADVGKGNAVARRYLSLKNGEETLDVRPGDIIPARFGAAEQVEKGKASWQ